MSVQPVPPSIFTLPINPANYGVSASEQGLNRLICDLYQHINDQITQDVTARVTAQIAERLHAQFTAEYEQKLQAKLLEMYEQMQTARRRFFGASTDAAQARLFDEAEVLASTSTQADDSVDLGVTAQPEQDQAVSAKPGPSKARGKRAPLAADLPRVEVIHDVPEDQRVCACGTPMVCIGEEVSEQLDIIPMQVRVLRHIRKRYACPSKDQAPIIAAVPPQVLPRSNASDSLLAMLITSKYVDGLPLYRMESVFDRHGVQVPRQTQARWMIACARAMQPLFNLMRDQALDWPVIHMDETTVQVLKEPGRAATSKSYMWVQVAGPPERPVVLYDYAASRAQRVPNALLEGWTGYLMTDGYRGYNAVGRQQGVTLLACWAHVRRKYIDAQRLHKGKRGHADTAIELIGQLYKVEKDMRQASVDQRLEARQNISVPLLEKLRQWHEKVSLLVPPSSALGRALAYQQALWPRLTRYVERGDLPIDNNRCENAIRPFVLGRRAWLFSDTPAGAHASAVIYSLLETVKANGLEPYAWLCRVLRELPKATTADDYEALLPWNLSPEAVLSEAFADLPA